MRHFNYISEIKEKEIFYKKPEPISFNSDKELIAYGLGATIYVPALHGKISTKIINKELIGVVSMVICLEDAIGDSQVIEAEEMLFKELELIKNATDKGEILIENIPFIFIRVRNPNQLLKLHESIVEYSNIVYGFVFPKFSVINGKQYMKNLQLINTGLKKGFMAMPILETPDLIHWETRREALEKLVGICEEHKYLITNIRIGATDFSSIFGLRRGHDYTVYDIQVIRDCITDIINTFCRVGRDFIVSGPVWEYFWSGTRKLKPMLRTTPFTERYGESGIIKRAEMIDDYLDGLIYEVLLDRMNGLIGKTVIHPTHIIPVQSLYVVSHEDYMDALSIMESNNDKVGVMKSSYENKMNEVKPHKNWAYKTLLRARAYGVFNDGFDYVSLLK